MPVELLRRMFTVKDYHKMMADGVLTESDRVELIRGEIIQMSPMGPRHTACVKRLNELFMSRLAGRITIGVQDPVELDDNSEPQPDISLLRRRADFYATGHPQSEDIFLLVEVADSTVNYDREVKVPLYAEDNIREVWLVNINDGCLEVYREPAENGYQNVRQFQEEETVTIQAFPDVVFTVDELLG
ncbi:MAG: Uma2 family endonuclease [Hormoscilla sp. GM7CHS1pb]|nr:Uma2 family endonuclease [Hormoscilla sp. GM7CHS1pb]